MIFRWFNADRAAALILALAAISAGFVSPMLRADVAQGSEVTTGFRCLSSAGARPVQLEWRTFHHPRSGWSGAMVLYRRSRTPISLVWVERRETEAMDRPVEREERYVEMVDGRVNGEYRATTQGARVVRFHYARRDGRTLEFSEDLVAFDSERRRCTWPP